MREAALNLDKYFRNSLIMLFFIVVALARQHSTWTNILRIFVCFFVNILLIVFSLSKGRHTNIDKIKAKIVGLVVKYYARDYA